MDIYNILKYGEGEQIELDEEIMSNASRCIHKMIELGG
jgi:quinolinate synthase